jgi:SAM-dependent methyltransferase
MKEKNKFSYNSKVGDWWLQHSLDSAHRRAYRKIADLIRDSYVRDPAFIVDYACGPGNLLALLSLRFKSSKLVGLDGSSFLLSHARRRFSILPRACSERISLIETQLPDLKLLHGMANLVTYCFPNMVPFLPVFPRSNSILCKKDSRAARSLSLATYAGEGRIEERESSANQDGLEWGRSISMNLRRLLVRGGICVRVEYATTRRHELAPHELSQVTFEEGSLDASIDGHRPQQWFRFVASVFSQSGVLEDVYEQTGDERDRNGGYLITVLRAI